MLIACFCWQTSFANDETLPSGKTNPSPKNSPLQVFLPKYLLKTSSGRKQASKLK
jgi:hypothetical protein